jgi:catechol 2,3-dioxygenase-like lactoylglutathione lyase family enzyme
MAIDNILINVADVRRSVDFYTKFLSAGIVGEVTDDRAVLDLVTATITLARVADPAASTWIADDLHRGFRHVGFKVDDVDPFVEVLQDAGVRFHLLPIDAEGEVRITFFYDPDGTLLELVAGDLHYHDVTDEAGVARERALGIPERPRFDHVAVTVEDLQATIDFYAPYGFGRIGSIHQTADPRGFEIDYLKGGDSVLEVFTYTAPKTARSPQADALGFACADLEPATGPVPAADTVGTAADGRTVHADADGFVFSVGAGAGGPR